MLMSVVVLVVSSALFLFYAQTICEKALRREFSQAYSKQIIQAVKLEYPQLRDSVASNGSFNYVHARLALKCDYFTLEYLLRNGDPSHRHFTRIERLLSLYFRFLLVSLPLRHAFKLKEQEAVVRLASILHYFASSLGEKLSVTSFATAQTIAKS
jgi:hypothetical protein